MLYRDQFGWKQIRKQSRSRSGLIHGQRAEKAVQIQAAHLLKQLSRRNRNLEVTGRTNIRFRPQRGESRRLHGQQCGLSLSEKQLYTQPLDCGNTKQGSTTYGPELVDPLRMAESTFWNRGK